MKESCLICGAGGPFKAFLSTAPEHGVCFQCSRGAEQAKPVAEFLEDAREKLDALIAEASERSYRARLIAVDAILRTAKRQLGYPNVGLDRYQPAASPLPRGGQEP